MFERQRKLPTPEEIREELPLSASLKRIKLERDDLCRNVLSGKSEKMLIIVGPCSAHDFKAVLEYGKRLGKLSEMVADKLVLIPRIYTNKPRSRGIGYKGMFLQPDPGREEDICQGIRMMRRMHLCCLEESNLSAADELLFPEHLVYAGDLISYYTVGARSSEDPLHRATASGLDCPVGMKNPLDGNMKALVDSIYAAQNSQVFPCLGWQVKTDGNPFAHAILRGAGGNGLYEPNYHYETLQKLLKEWREANLSNPSVIVDTNHSNSGKRFEEQSRVVEEVMLSRKFDAEIKKFVKGFMIESFLVEGCQSRNEIYGKSITDPCMGWEMTEQLILRIADQL